MSKLDGLVLKLCIDKFAKYDLQLHPKQAFDAVYDRIRKSIHEATV